MSLILSSFGNQIGWFLIQNWYWVLLGIVVLIGLGILNKFLKIFSWLWKLIKIPLKLIWELFKLPFKAIKNAMSEKDDAERRSKE